MIQIKATVEKITYRNDENGYTVLRAFVEGSRQLTTVVGNMPGVNTGSILLLTGDYHHDKKYGDQFVVTSFRETLPSGVAGIEKYLGSGMIKGIGPAAAKLIVRKFGRDTIDVLDNHPERLTEVWGIGKKKSEQIIKGWNEQKEVRNIMLFLQDHDISGANAVKIYQEYGNAAIDVIKDNPYRLADEIYGIGFKSADIIASKLGFEKNDLLRLRSGILYVMNVMASSGHVYAGRDELITGSMDLLEADGDKVEMALEAMCACEALINDSGRIYIPAYYEAEEDCALRLRDLMEYQRNHPPDAGYGAVPDGYDGAEYDEVQKEAIATALKGGVMILTGGPGTGKTTVTKGIIRSLACLGKEILLAAPTGRAAKRMSEATGMDAKTIHRLLEYSPPEGFTKDHTDPLIGDVLILDEASMIDLMLLSSLLDAVPPSMQLIFIGDTDQLPSVGAGNVLRDLISCGAFPVIRLTKVYRQAAQSRIITNAHRINSGQMPEMKNSADSDFFFIEEKDSEKIPELICGLVKERLPSYMKCSPLDVQVLTPMQKSDSGVINLNKLLQSELNPNGLSVSRGGTVFRVNDKVMQIKNNYDKDVFNGDIGRITYADTEEKSINVLFDSKVVKYEHDELDELVLAYAVTVHKSQGSEYPVVVMPVTFSHYVMLQRNLLYTAVTRAKKLMVLVGETKALERAVGNQTVDRRNSMLDERIRTKMAGRSPIR